MTSIFKYPEVYISRAKMSLFLWSWRFGRRKGTNALWRFGDSLFTWGGISLIVGAARVSPV
jgi:hypothetical protein